MTVQRKREIQTDKRARFTEFRNNAQVGQPFYVHFNPASLQVQLTNELEQEDGETVQYIKKSSQKLTMDLIFDTTDRNTDVRRETVRIARFMRPSGQSQQENTPATVLFEWGSFAFRGLVESYKETVDFFSRDGLPLRSTVNVVLSQQDLMFRGSAAAAADAVQVRPVEGDDITSMVSRAGNENAGRDAAAANGLESMRFPEGAIELDASISLGGAVAFATGASLSAGAGFGISAGGGIGVSGGAGLSLGGGIGVSGGAGLSLGGGIGVSGGAGLSIGGGAGISLGGSAGLQMGASASFEASVSVQGPEFGGRAAIGLTASQGAFAGLRAQATRVFGPPLDVSRLLPPANAARVGVDGGGGFHLGGRASASASLDVTGPSGTLSSHVRFEGE